MKRKIMGILSIILTLCLVFILSFYLEYSRATSVFHDYLAIWENEISREILTNKGDELLQKIVAQAPLLHGAIQIQSIEAGGKSTEVAKTGSCPFPLRQSLTYNLLPVGVILGCLQEMKLIEASVLSPMFVGVVFLIFLGFLWYFKREENIRIELQVSRLLTNISRQLAHDIRAPLSAIQTVLTTTDEIESGRKKLLESAANRMQEIARDLLEKTKFEPAQKKNQKAEIPPGFNVTACLESLIEQSQVTYPNVVFQFENSTGANLKLKLSQSIFERIFSNLLQNAIEASEQKGKIFIRISSRETNAFLSILDQGMGMTEEQLSKIGKTGVTFKKNGNGLGVSYAIEQLNAAGGKLEISSKLNKGTLVQIVIPIFLQ